MDYEIYFWIVFKGIFGIISGIMLYLIWKYLSKKPLGLETLFDLLIKDLILTLAMSLITFQISMIKAKYFCPKNNDQCIHVLALAVLHLGHFNFAAILMQILVCNIVRYLSIFHQSVLTEISDKKIVKMARLVVLFSAFLSNLLDNIGQGDHLYTHLTDAPKVEMTDEHIYTIVLMLVLNIVVLLWIQVKIEKYEKKVDELIRVEDQQEAQDNLYAGLDKGTVRKIIAVLVIGIIFFLFWASTVGSEKKPHAEKARVGGFAHCFPHCSCTNFFHQKK